VKKIRWRIVVRREGEDGIMCSLNSSADAFSVNTCRLLNIGDFARTS
jgi:hypothetical protein